MGRNKRKNGFLSFMVWILVIAGAIALISYIIRSQAFTVRLNGQALKNQASGIELLYGETYEFEVLNTETEDYPEGGFTVSISPYNKDDKTDFKYIAGNEWKWYTEIEKDLTEYFTITENENGFSLLVENDISDILQKIHTDKYYSIEDGVVQSNADYFLLTVLNADGSKSISVYFRIGYSLMLDQEHLEF